MKKSFERERKAYNLQKDEEYNKKVLKRIIIISVIFCAVGAFINGVSG